MVNPITMFLALLIGILWCWLMVEVVCFVSRCWNTPKQTPPNSQAAEVRGIVFKTLRDAQISRQHRCNHKMGGFITAGQFPSIGDDEEYAVINHQFPWGDAWVKCLRCNQTWKPGDPDYQWARELKTRNQASSSCQIKMNVARARELTKDS